MPSLKEAGRGRNFPHTSKLFLYNILNRSAVILHIKIICIGGHYAGVKLRHEYSFTCSVHLVLLGAGTQVCIMMLCEIELS